MLTGGGGEFGDFLIFALCPQCSLGTCAVMTWTYIMISSHGLDVSMCVYLGFGGDQSLTNLPWPLVTLLLRNLNWGFDWNIGALLDWDVHTLLALNLS